MIVFTWKALRTCSRLLFIQLTSRLSAMESTGENVESQKHKDINLLALAKLKTSKTEKTSLPDLEFTKLEFTKLEFSKLQFTKRPQKTSWLRL